MKSKYNRLSHLSQIVFAVATVTSAQAAPLYFDTAANTVWDAATTSDWSTVTTGPYNSLWASTSDATFEGTSGTVNVSGTIAGVNSIAFNTDGYQLGTSVGSGTLTLTGTGGNITTGAGTDTINSIIGGSVGLTKLGTGTLKLNAANTFSGLTISSGTVTGDITTNTAFGTGGTITLNDVSTGAANTSLLISATTGYTTLSRPITVANQGSGTVTIGAVGTGSGPNLSSTVTLNRATTIDSTGASDRVFFGGTLTGNVGTLTCSGGHRIVLPGTSSWTGNVAITGSNTNVQVGGNSIPDASNVDVGTGALLRLQTSESINVLTGSGGVENLGGGTQTLTVGAGNGSGTFSGNIGYGGNSVNLTKIGTGTQTLSGASSYTGATTISAGTIISTVTNAFGSTTGITLNDTNTGSNNTALLADFSSNLMIPKPITVANLGTGTVTIGSVATVTPFIVTEFTSAVTLNRATTIQCGSTDRTTFDSAISGTVGLLTVTGGHRLTFGATNTFVGDIAITGTNTWMQVGGNQIPDASNVDVGAGASLRVQAAESINALTGSGYVTNSAGASLLTLTVGAGNGSGTFSGNIGSGGVALNLTKAGTGTQTLSSANSYTGATTISAGTIVATVNNPFGSSPGVNLNDASTGTNDTALLAQTSGMNIGSSITVANLGTGKSILGGNSAVTSTFSGSVALNKGLTVTATSGGTVTFSGAITGSNNVTKEGLGTVIFSTAKAYSGTTSVTSGTLEVDNTLASSGVIVNGGTLNNISTGIISGTASVSSGTLSNAGTISGATTVSSGGTLQGKGTLSSTLSVTGTGIVSPGLVAGDTLHAGATTISGHLAVQVDDTFNSELISTGSINLSGGTVDLTLGGGGFSQPYYVIAQGSSITGTLPSVAPGYSLTNTGTQLRLSQTPTNTFSNWLSTNYPGLTGSDALPGADPDHDGLTNLMEYALNTNPTASSQPPGTRAGNTLTFTKGAMAKADSNIAYSIEESTDLVTWTTPTGTSPSGSVSNVTDTITYTFPSTPTNIFARLKVIQTP